MALRYEFLFKFFAVISFVCIVVYCLLEMKSTGRRHKISSLNLSHVSLLGSKRNQINSSILNGGLDGVFTRQTFNKYITLIEEFVGICEYHDIIYMMYGGTLIGSFRHHGPIPWDDDLDFIIPLGQKHQLRKAASRYKHRYMLIDQGDRFKFFSYTGERHGDHRTWTWPFIDIFYFSENKTHIWDSSIYYKDEYIYRKDMIFPLKRRPFLNLMLYSPNQPEKVLDLIYDIRWCVGRYYDHKRGRVTKGSKSMPCTSLNDYYPFVKRTQSKKGVKEELVVGNKILQWYYFPVNPANMFTYWRNFSIDLTEFYMHSFINK